MKSATTWKVAVRSTVWRSAFQGRLLSIFHAGALCTLELIEGGVQENLESGDRCKQRTRDSKHIIACSTAFLLVDSCFFFFFHVFLLEAYAKETKGRE
jgi:hypothetical protein